MKAKIKEKLIARRLRRQGCSFNEIANKLHISKSSCGQWLRDVVVTGKGRKRLLKRREIGQKRSQETRRVRLSLRKERVAQSVGELMRTLKVDNRSAKIFCALLYWCEGTKDDQRLIFTNSDPVLVQLFMKLMRQAFMMNEARWRALVHIHEYHDDICQKKFWSKITGIPFVQFHKSYKKPHTGHNKRSNYPGCISIRYGDMLIAHELVRIYQQLAENYGSVG